MSLAQVRSRTTRRAANRRIASSRNSYITPDAHFMTEARYRGQKVVVVSPDYSNHTKFADHWLPAQPGTDGALAMAMGHVILKEFYVERQVPYFQAYARRFTDLPCLVMLRRHDDACPARSGASRRRATVCWRWSRKCVIELVIGPVANSPRAHKALPTMLSQTSSNRASQAVFDALQLGTKKSIAVAREHGHALDRDGRTYFFMYHPAAALRSPAVKPDLVADFQTLKQLLTDKHVL